MISPVGKSPLTRAGYVVRLLSMSAETTPTPSKAETDTRRKLRALWEQGFTVRESASLLQISTQRVYQLLDDMGLR